MNLLIDLFVSFAKIGVLTFGGGMAMLPMLERELINKHHWIDEEEMLDYYAIGQCTPGIIAVNTATLVGKKLKGTIGGIVATIGVVFPSIVIILCIAAFLSNFADIVWIQHAFAGIRICVCALVLNAVIKLSKKTAVDIATTIIFIITTIGTAVFDLSPIIFVVAAGVAGLVLKNSKQKEEKNK